MSTVFLSGSRKVTRLNQDVQARLDNIIRKGMAIVIGDANGADKAMQLYLAQKEYSNVEVFFAGNECRNNIGSWAAVKIKVDPKLKGRAIHEQKDKAMAIKATFGFVLWDGKSIGSMTNVCELLAQSKISLIYLLPRKEFFEINGAEKLKELFNSCAAEDVQELESSPIIERQMSDLGISAQQKFDL